MAEELSVELIAGKELIQDPGLRSVMREAGEPFAQAAQTVNNIGLTSLPELAGQMHKHAAQEEYHAALRYTCSWLDQIVALQQVEGLEPPEQTFPERTIHGTLFVPYEPSEIKVALPRDRSQVDPELNRPKYYRTAAIIATSGDLDRDQLGKELENDPFFDDLTTTVGAVTSLVTRFRRRELVVEVDSKKMGRRAKILRHTTEFDRVMNLLPSWQQAVKLRTLAHHLGKPEHEMIQTLLDLSLLLTAQA